MYWNHRCVHLKKQSNDQYSIWNCECISVPHGYSWRCKGKTPDQLPTTTGALWFKERSSLQTILSRWILSLKSLSEWLQTDHLLHFELISGVSSPHLIWSVQCSCSQVSTAESTAGLAWELQMFSRLPWNMLSAMPKNQVEQSSCWTKALTVPRHVGLHWSCAKLCCEAALLSPVQERDILSQ